MSYLPRGNSKRVWGAKHPPIRNDLSRQLSITQRGSPPIHNRPPEGDGELSPARRVNRHGLAFERAGLGCLGTSLMLTLMRLRGTPPPLLLHFISRTDK